MSPYTYVIFTKVLDGITEHYRIPFFYSDNEYCDPHAHFFL